MRPQNNHYSLYVPTSQGSQILPFVSEPSDNAKEAKPRLLRGVVASGIDNIVMAEEKNANVFRAFRTLKVE